MTPLFAIRCASKSKEAPRDWLKYQRLSLLGQLPPLGGYKTEMTAEAAFIHFPEEIRPFLYVYPYYQEKQSWDSVVAPANF